MHRGPTPPLAQTADRQLRRRRGGRAAWALALGLLGTPALGADWPIDEPTQALLVEAVEAAAALDAYHARCRGDGSGRRTDNLNKKLASKLRTTVLSVQDDLFPERSYRKAQARLRTSFAETLRSMGGCAAAKEAGLPAELRARYDAMMQAIDALP